MEIIIKTKPISKERPRLGRNGRTYTPNKTLDFEGLIAWQYKKLGGKYFDDKPIQMKLTFAFKVPKSYTKKQTREALEGTIIPTKCDLDNLVKAIQDGLNGVAYKDDRYIRKIIAEKKYDIEEYVKIEIVEG